MLELFGSKVTWISFLVAAGIGAIVLLSRGKTGQSTGRGGNAGSNVAPAGQGQTVSGSAGGSQDPTMPGFPLSPIVPPAPAPGGPLAPAPQQSTPSDPLVPGIGNPGPQLTDNSPIMGFAPSDLLGPAPQDTSIAPSDVYVSPYMGTGQPYVYTNPNPEAPSSTDVFSTNPATDTTTKVGTITGEGLNTQFVTTTGQRAT